MLEGSPPKTGTYNNRKKNRTVFKENSDIRILQYDNTACHSDEISNENRISNENSAMKITIQQQQQQQLT